MSYERGTPLAIEVSLAGNRIVGGPEAGRSERDENGLDEERERVPFHDAAMAKTCPSPRELRLRRT